MRIMADSASLGHSMGDGSCSSTSSVHSASSFCTHRSHNQTGSDRSQKVPRALTWLGPRTVTLKRHQSRGFGFTLAGKLGCVLTNVVPGGEADKAGIKENDRLVAIGGRDVSRLAHNRVVAALADAPFALMLTVDDTPMYALNARRSQRSAVRKLTASDEQKISSPDSFDHGRSFASGSKPTPPCDFGLRRHATAATFTPPARDHPPLQKHLSVSSRPAKLQSSGHFPSLAGTSVGASVHKCGTQVKGACDRILSEASLIAHAASPVMPRRRLAPPIPSMSNAHDTKSNPMRPARHSTGFVFSRLARRHAAGNAAANDDKIATGASGHFDPGDQSGQRFEGAFVPAAGGVLFEDAERTSALVMQAGLVYIGAIPISHESGTSGNGSRSGTDKTLGRIVSDCVRALVAQKAKAKTVLMQIFAHEILVTNSRATITHRMRTPHIQWASVSDANSQYFGVTSVAPGARAPVCHVFAADPQLNLHSIHGVYAMKFGIMCSRDPETSYCREFPSVATPVVRALKTVILSKPERNGLGLGGTAGSDSELCGPRSNSEQRSSVQSACSMRQLKQQRVQLRSDHHSQSSSSSPRQLRLDATHASSDTLPPSADALPQHEPFAARRGHMKDSGAAAAGQGAKLRVWAPVARQSSQQPASAAGAHSNSGLARTRPTDQPCCEASSIESTSRSLLVAQQCLSGCAASRRVSTSQPDLHALLRADGTPATARCKEEGRAEPVAARSTAAGGGERVDSCERPRGDNNAPMISVHELDEALRSQATRRPFETFLEQQFCGENLAFWLAVEQYRSAPAAQRRRLATEMYERFCCATSADTVNVDAKTTRNIEAAVKQGCFEPTLFDPAQLQIFHLLRYDIWPRYLKWRASQPQGSLSSSSTGGKGAVGGDAAAAGPPESQAGNKSQGQGVKQRLLSKLNPKFSRRKKPSAECILSTNMNMPTGDKLPAAGTSAPSCSNAQPYPSEYPHVGSAGSHRKAEATSDDRSTKAGGLGVSRKISASKQNSTPAQLTLSCTAATDLPCSSSAADAASTSQSVPPDVVPRHACSAASLNQNAADMGDGDAESVLLVLPDGSEVRRRWPADRSIHIRRWLGLIAQEHNLDARRLLLYDLSPQRSTSVDASVHNFSQSDQMHRDSETGSTSHLDSCSVSNAGARVDCGTVQQLCQAGATTLALRHAVLFKVQLENNDACRWLRTSPGSRTDRCLRPTLLSWHCDPTSVVLCVEQNRRVLRGCDSLADVDGCTVVVRTRDQFHAWVNSSDQNTSSSGSWAAQPCSSGAAARPQTAQCDASATSEKSGRLQSTGSSSIDSADEQRFVTDPVLKDVEYVTRCGPAPVCSNSAKRTASEASHGSEHDPGELRASPVTTVEVHSGGSPQKMVARPQSDLPDFVQSTMSQSQCGDSLQRRQCGDTSRTALVRLPPIYSTSIGVDGAGGDAAAKMLARQDSPGWTGSTV